MSLDIGGDDIGRHRSHFHVDLRPVAAIVENDLIAVGERYGVLLGLVVTIQLDILHVLLGKISLYELLRTLGHLAENHFLGLSVKRQRSESACENKNNFFHNEWF